MEWYDLDWIILAQDIDRWRDPVKNGNEFSGSVKRGNNFA
jgi:hypothetical protein